VSKHVASNPSTSAGLGVSVDIDGDALVVGARVADAGAGGTEGAAYVYYLGDMVLDITPPAVFAGDTLTFSTCGGSPSGLAALFLVSVDGTPFFSRLANGTFRSDEYWILQTTVPPGISGLTVAFQTIGVASSGNLALSNPDVVTFQ
jgi:hypothetical protein